jgi:recombination protein RecR
MVRYPQPLETLIRHLKMLPGVGQKTAERYAFHLLKIDPKELCKLKDSLATIKEDIKPCPECGCFLEADSCPYCSTLNRQTSLLCITSSVKDVFAIEQTHIFQGLYHVIPKLLSPLDGGYESQIGTHKIKERIERYKIKEVIIALDSTLEGDATGLYLKQELANLGTVVSRLAMGLPLGSSLDFIDEGTLNRAFLGRQPV